MAQSSIVFLRARQPRIDTVVWVIALVLVGIAIAYFSSRHSDLGTVLYGFSPNVLFEPVWEHAIGFERDFPNGEQNALRSLAGQFYRLLGFLPGSENTLHGVAIGMEFAVLAIGGVICARAVTPGQPYWIALLTAVYLGSSTLLDSDLARWGHPFYGAVYNFANGAGLAAVGLILNRRIVSSGLSLALAGMCHPIIALLFVIPCAIIGLASITRYSIGRIAVAIVLPAGLSVLWVAFNYADTDVGGGAIDVRLFIELSRMMSSHWYPIDLEVFGARSWETFIPFMAVFVVFFAALGRVAGHRFPFDGVIAVSVLALFVATALGVWISEYVASAVLIKLALHRASAIALLLAGTLLIPRLVLILRDGSLPLAFMAAACLLLPLWRGDGWPIVGAIVFASVLLAMQCRDAYKWWFWLGSVVLLVVILAFATLLQQGHTTLWQDSNTFALSIWRIWFAVWLLLLVTCLRWLAFPAIVAPIVAFLSFGQAERFDYLSDPATRSQAEEFRDVQTFARDNTPPGALFMIDPTHGYGWRHLSQRPSFGTIREWLYTSWAYDSRPELLNDGVARVGALGLDLESYLALEDTTPGQGKAKLYESITQAYYALETDMVRKLRDEYGVEYFVLDKTKITKGASWEFLFETGRYGILSTAQILSH